MHVSNIALYLVASSIRDVLYLFRCLSHCGRSAMPGDIDDKFVDGIEFRERIFAMGDAGQRSLFCVCVCVCLHNAGSRESNIR